MTCEEAIKKLKKLANAKSVAGMARFGINPKGTLGVSMPNVRSLAKKIGRNHKLAEGLWQTGIHEARILAGLVDDPALVSKSQADRWVKDFDSWDVCDQVCMNLFDKTPFAFGKAREWAQKKQEFVKRAGFALMASLAVHDKKASNQEFIKFFPLVKKACADERNFVRKAVNWALRQIGKRNIVLNKQTIEIAKEMQSLNNKTAMWIASDALRELKSQAVQEKLV